MMSSVKLGSKCLQIDAVTYKALYLYEIYFGLIWHDGVHDTENRVGNYVFF